MPGPLNDIRVIEMAAIGPVPFCGMLLGDMGADVLRIDRADGVNPLGGLVDVCARGKESLGVDLKNKTGVALVLRLVEEADVLLEGFRPGVAERLGIGPEDVAAVNPGLVYGRMTGWGQDGPLATTAGHDINYISLAGALHAIGDDDPVVPLNLIGDYGGGALYLALGVLAALHERESSGLGQVVDAAMVDGVASLMTPTYQLAAAGLWADRRSSNLLDGEAPFYRAYQTADGGHVAVGALEPQFYQELLRLLAIEPGELPAQYHRDGWTQIRDRLAAEFIAEPRAHWEAVFGGSDACVTPVLSMEEAPNHPHNLERTTFVDAAGSPEPAPAPRFSRSRVTSQDATLERAGGRIVAAMGVTDAELAELADAGVVASRSA